MGLAVIAEYELPPIRKELKASLASGKFHSTCSNSDETDHCPKPMGHVTGVCHFQGCELRATAPSLC